MVYGLWPSEENAALLIYNIGLLIFQYSLFFPYICMLLTKMSLHVPNPMIYVVFSRETFSSLCFFICAISL